MYFQYLYFYSYLFLMSVTAEEIFENSTNICSKCTCDYSDDAQTLTLDCSKKHFIHMLAAWPPHNATIKASFAYNNLKHLQKLPSTAAVVEIILSNCNLKILNPEPLESIVNIKFLDLSHNLLTSEQLTPGIFKGPYNGTKPTAIALEELDLSYNQIHSLQNNVFKFAPNLKRLNLKGNDFVLLDIHTQLALTSLRGLTSLNLADNELTDLVKSAIEGLDYLRELDLSINDLDFVPYSLKAVAKSLQVVILDGNPIIEMTEESFQGLEKLSEISANNLTKLHHINSSAFAPTLNLKKLSLTNNPSLEDINVDAFSPNQAIEELYLNDNNLSTVPFDLISWQQLTNFALNNNPLTCNCDLYKIATSLPTSITRISNGPTCFDLHTSTTIMVYNLDSAICEPQTLPALKPRILRHHFSIPLTGLIVVLSLGLFVAIALGYSRYKKFASATRNPYVSQVVYSPLFNRAV
ncbi:phospholipase A2 inhibitor-like [Tribolium madens]|uniref:phospholipase A2 inhibitor-like n=1 Tax=Tribolium madens TaxID=41895 RepID=UPI001CF75D5F|nr:phospholipase A2 inhibitor-like [Tribolium madens]